MKKVLLGVVIFLLVITGGMLWTLSELELPDDQDHQASAAAIATGVGEKLPEFTLPSLTKKAVTVKTNGKPIVINFFTTWCPPCRHEMPELEMFVNKYKTVLDFYAVNIQESPNEVAGFMDKNNYSFKDALLFDESGQVSDEFRINAIPTTIIVDKDGIVRHVQLGSVDMQQLEEFLEKLPKN